MTRLLISGVPGSGKSTYCEWLRDTHNFQFYEFDRLGSIPDESSLRDIDAVLEWGFNPLVSLTDIQQLIENGWQHWWFDGDREAALECYLNKRSSAGFDENQMTVAKRLWFDQIARIESCWVDINSLFRGKQLNVIGARRNHLENHAIFSLMFDHPTDSSQLDDSPPQHPAVTSEPSKG